MQGHKTSPLEAAQTKLSNGHSSSSGDVAADQDGLSLLLNGEETLGEDAAAKSSHVEKAANKMATLPEPSPKYGTSFTSSPSLMQDHKTPELEAQANLGDGYISIDDSEVDAKPPAKDAKDIGKYTAKESSFGDVAAKTDQLTEKAQAKLSNGHISSDDLGVEGEDAKSPEKDNSTKRISNDGMMMNKVEEVIISGMDYYFGMEACEEYIRHTLRTKHGITRVITIVEGTTPFYVFDGTSTSYKGLPTDCNHTPSGAEPKIKVRYTIEN